ncbi:MAG: tetratricopeptide repeat protein [Bacteriovoracaceae bacterium]|nr:tetratricopeptide repeat protein [Bacteriovoracaceae bacterium]
MSKRLFILLFLLLGAQSAFSLSMDERRQKIISIIDEELSEINRLSSQVKGSNPDYLLRMAELNLEKARLWREKENKEYLELDSKKRRSVNKKKYFSKSASYFARANRLSVLITKKFPRYTNISDVYYILGFNAKEAGRDKTATKYFRSANRKSSSKSITKVKSQISLAEIYYNERKYSQAIPLYESALRKYQDKWWTKDSFNLAWCYYRDGRTSKAVNKMKEVFEQSSNPKYIDMRSQVERDIGMFYATSGKIKEGIEFFKKIGINFTRQLLRIAVTLRDQGKYTQSEKTLNYALKYEDDQKKFGEIYLEKLALYDKFGKESSHLAASKKLFSLFKKGNLSSNEVKTLNYQMQRQSAKLQKQVVSKTYKRLKKTRNRKAAMAIDYFEMLTHLDKKNADQHLFHKAETAYANYDWPKAIVFYNDAFESADKSNNKKLLVNSMEGMLSTLGQRRLSSSIKNQFYAPVYEKYLSRWPRGKRAKSIYSKLFRVYLDKKDYPKAKSVLDRYAKAYPKDWKTQETMIANMMEVSRKSKDYSAIRVWIDDINANKYAVSAKYKKKLQELLTTIQIEGVQNSLSKGDKSVALKGYHKILTDPHSTKRSKVNAKYNLAALYYELGSTKNAYKWAVESLREMPTKDATSFVDSFLTISGFLFTKLQFEASADLSTRVVAKLCSSKSRKKSVAFKNSVYLHLSEGDVKKAQDLISLGKRCRVPSTHIVDAQFELMEEYRDKKMYNDYESLANQLFKVRSAQGRLVHHFFTLEGIHKKFNNTGKANLYGKFKRQAYRNAVKRKQDVPLEGLDVIADEQLQELLGLFNSMKRITLRFPEKTFNTLLKRKLSYLDRMTKKAGDIQQVGSGRGIIGAYKILVEAYDHAGQEVEDFSPAGKSKEYIASFKSSMAQVAIPLKQSALNYKAEGWKAIEDNKILSDFNYLLSPRPLDGMTIKYAYPNKAVSMDRSGRR